MSLDIDQIALHQLIKRDEAKSGAGAARVTAGAERDGRRDDGWNCTGSIAPKAKPMACSMKRANWPRRCACSVREEEFLAFSRAATGRLRDELAKYPFAEGGIVLFCQYRYLAVEYLLVAVLNNLSSMRVNEELDIRSTHYLDINHADIVARIDLTGMGNQPGVDPLSRPSWKGRVGRKVADFFMDFLGASEGLNAKARRTAACCRRWMTSPPMPSFDKSERQNVRQQVYAYCKRTAAGWEEIELESLSKELAGVSEKSFQGIHR
ncbi:nucleoid-associated protein [Klebsiella pneumoniae subsp. pneumoniae]|nr:nucleoid-associated protein [Klebsiella pneumoniae subsp. pneumoniae]